jgi:Ca-activated chloride channel family protein
MLTPFARLTCLTRLTRLTRVTRVTRVSVLALVACAGTDAALAAPGAPGALPAPPPPAAPDITVDVDVGEPMMIAGQEQSAYIKITLGGFALPQQQQRPPINLALVLDRSASMAGDKLEKAKEAALMVADRLQPDDIISLVTYDSVVEILVPATRATARDAIREQVSALTPRGSTALFAGVAHGLEELAKNLSPSRVNRMILLSDGQANVGPRSPNELGRLGEVAARQGISITTIGLGLGYNEDLMTQLAVSSDGNHAFVENATDLAQVFQHELGDVLSVVAQDVEIEIELAPGVTPVRAIGRDATITGNKARVSLSQLYAKQQKHVLLEVKVPPGAAGKKRALADVAVSYANMLSKQKATRRAAAAVEFSAARGAVAARQNKQVLEAAALAIATDNNRKAVALRDQGNAQDAERVLQDNARYLKQEAARLQSKQLEVYGERNARDAVQVKGQDWGRARKTMREDQAKKATQQAW